MSIAYLNLAFSAPLSGATKSVLIAIADRANDNGFCYQNVLTIAQRAGITERYASKVIRKLEMLEFLTVIRHSGRSSHYFINREKLEKLSTTPEQNNGVKVIHSPELREQTPELRGQNPRTEFTQTIKNHQEPKKRAREAMTENVQHAGHLPTKQRRTTYPAQAWTDSPSFRLYTPQPMPKAQWETVKSEVRSIRSILTGRA